MIGEVGEDGAGDEFVADFVYIGDQIVGAAFGAHGEGFFLVGEGHFTGVVGDFFGELKEMIGHGMILKLFLSYWNEALSAGDKVDKIVYNAIIHSMVFLQALYGLLLAAKMQVNLSSKSQGWYSTLLSGERKHRIIR